ncbi:hypothetical protein EVAR_48583_1 [Eumeta japonica]|uniref:Uncharacterized protein n=1 Tax=Eumeta variegata TaxID=151549 RepID=A0A4C1XF49_EUMVA|nr:hypothetical protein EVAR_48583_1 [Eumeta japonica]
MRSLRSTCGVFWKDRCRNDVRERCGLKEDVASATSATADGLAPEGPRKQKSFAYKLLKRGLANLMSPTSTSGVAPPLLKRERALGGKALPTPTPHEPYDDYSEGVSLNFLLIKRL